MAGGTGSVGQHVVDAALQAGHRVRITLADAVHGIDAVIFTHGTHGGEVGARDVDYGGVRNILTAVGDRPVRIALMTAIGVTVRGGAYNQASKTHDWKRRAERLVRVSGHYYTIVRPGWFDYNDADQHELRFLQGDTRRAGSSADGVIARSQIADVLVSALTSPGAAGKTLELVAEYGPAQTDLNPLFAALSADTGFDGVSDIDNQPIEDEPLAVMADFERIKAIAK